MIRALTLAGLIAVGLHVAPPTKAEPLPFDVGGAFELVDQYGASRSQVDPDGHAQLLFFGYANCPGICSAAMPMMADVTDLVALQGLKISPVMITIDPDRDVVGTLGKPMARLHDKFIGLTGSDTALAQAYQAYSVEKQLAFVDPETGPVYSHGSFVYLLDDQGEVLTLLPPVLDAQRVATIILGYIQPKE